MPYMQSTTDALTDEEYRSHRIRVKNRRRRYLEQHPEYFSPSLELADPLLYDMLVRQFQTPAEREAEGKKKGYSGILEADLWRSEAKIEALHNPDPNSSLIYKRGANGEIVAVDEVGSVKNKQEGMTRWKDEMGRRFVEGRDDDFEYVDVDDKSEFDDREQEERDREDAWFGEEEPDWAVEDEGNEDEHTGRSLTPEQGTGTVTASTPSSMEPPKKRVRQLQGETGIQDY